MKGATAAEATDATTEAAPDLRAPITMRGRVVRSALRLGMRLYLALLAVARAVARPRAGDPAGAHVLLTLNFHAAGWPQALLSPLVASGGCRRLTLVTTAQVTGLPEAEVIHPPRWLQAVAGATAARLLTFAGVALRDRPSIVGGVHLLFNGLAAALVAALVRARSLYVCVGGPNEIAGGGLWSENRLFSRLAGPDPVLEDLLLRAARGFDAVVAMGTRGAAYFRERGATGRVAVIPSGVDPARCPAGRHERDVDIVLVARLVPLKRLDLFVETVACVAARHPDVRAVVVGVGPMMEPARALAAERGLGERLRFLGHEPDALAWLARSKVFLLPSDTEGVSISLIEAMMCGAVPVVSDVGDLGDVVQDGVSGFRIRTRIPARFAAPIEALLDDGSRRTQLSDAARAAAAEFTPRPLAARWEQLLRDVARHD